MTSSDTTIGLIPTDNLQRNDNTISTNTLFIQEIEKSKDNTKVRVTLLKVYWKLLATQENKLYII